MKEKLSNYLLVAVLQAMLAVCRGIKINNHCNNLYNKTVSYMVGEYEINVSTDSVHRRQAYCYILLPVTV